jgi:hypothetical protein
MTALFATPDGPRDFDDCTVDDLQYLLRERGKARPAGYCPAFNKAINMFIKAMIAQGVSTVGEVDGSMTFAEAMAPRS